MLDISGFSVTSDLTRGLWEKSLLVQKQWRTEFDVEKQRIMTAKLDDEAARKIKNPELRFMRMQELEEQRMGMGGANRISDLPNPVLYPCGKEEFDNDPVNHGCNEEGEEEEELRTGLPKFGLVMRVDIQGKFGKEKTVTAFQNSFGSMPASAMLLVTQMLFKSSRGSSKVRNLAL